MNKDYKLEEYIASFLFNLNGKLSKKDFIKIVKFYNWKFNFKSIHIVGTNGKGSNAKYLNDELILHNYKVGLFTSPHLIYMYERIKINDEEIDFQTLVKYTSDFQHDFPEINFGFFDLFFLTALRWFIERNVDIAIFEAGIGAKKDVVNYLNHQILLITSISLDHQKILGDSIDKIALDKSYAIKNKTNVYISDAIDAKIIKIFSNKAKKTNNNFYIVKTNKSNFVTINETLSKFVLKNEFQIQEFKSNFFLPNGRVQKIVINGCDCYIDVAHNLEGIKNSLKYFQSNEITFDQIVLSLSKDKDYNEIIETIKTHFDNIYVYQNKGRKPLTINEYPKDIPRIISLNGFIKKINCKTLFIGSFYLISEVLLGVDYNNK